MRRAWVTSVVATWCAVAMLAAPAAASPAGMTTYHAPAVSAPVVAPPMVAAPSAPQASSAWKAPIKWASWSPGSWKFWGKDEAAQKPMWQQTAATQELPSKQISKWRHPIKYFSASMAETPVARKFSEKKAEVPPAPSDSIALDKPVGAPTPQFMISLGQLAEQQGNIDQARTQFRQALAKWPNDVEVLRATARLEDRQGQLGVAESLYQRAVTVNPQHAGAYNDLGLCLARQGKLEQSVQALEMAIHLQPDKALYRNNAATVLVELRQDQRALAHLSAVHGAAASNYNLGQLLVTRGRPQQAAMYFQTAVDLDPSMEAARVALAQSTGTPVVPSQVASQVGPVPPTAESPSYGPQLDPQPSAPQPSFPATARGPGWDTSTSARPSAQIAPYSNSSVPAYGYGAPVYQTATAPRYLPPVQSNPAGTMVR